LEESIYVHKSESLGLMDVVSALLEEASHGSMPTTPKMKVSYWLISLLRILFITKHVFGF
jgi:hypothetical protein